jgi:hypothetical protein
MTMMLENESEEVVVETTEPEYNIAFSADGREFHLIGHGDDLGRQRWESEDGEVFWRVKP